MKEEKNILRSLLGLDTASTPVQTASSVIGGLLFGGGLLGALNAKQKTYTQATRYEQARIGEIGPAAQIRNKEAETSLTADLAGYGAATSARIKQGLEARGITDPNIGEQAVGRVKEGLSGAYATARATLARAKMGAGMAVSGALSTYQQGLAQKQYESMLANYYSKLGIWGSLGGLGAGLLDIKGNK